MEHQNQLEDPFMIVILIEYSKSLMSFLKTKKALTITFPFEVYSIKNNWIRFFMKAVMMNDEC